MKKFILFLLPLSLSAQIPDYYEGLDFKKDGKTIKEELHDLINATHQAVSYTPGVWNILDKSDLDLNSQGRVLLIYGFTDSKGADDYNLNLSNQRATAVKKKLMNPTYNSISIF